MSTNESIAFQPEGSGRVDGWLVLALALSVPFVHAALKLLGYRRVHRALSFLAPAVRGVPASLPEDDRLALDIRASVRCLRRRSPLSGSCLSRSLALWWLMRWRGRQTSLHLGTRRAAGAVQAHAWLTLAGRPLNAGPRVTQRYREFRHQFSP